MASRRFSRRPLLSIPMSRKLRHYLRNERRRAALTQADVAALLGGRWKGRICKYERGAIPPIEVALAYEAILAKPVSELLGGTFDDVAFHVRRRARDLLATETVPTNARRLRRRKTLERIAA
jgi:transcriptional regulator with XRE-family HTH domain